MDCTKEDWLQRTFFQPHHKLPLQHEDMCILEVIDFFPSTRESSKAVSLSLPIQYLVFIHIYLFQCFIMLFMDCNTGIYLRTRAGDNFVNLQRLKAKSKALTAVLLELLFTDDAAFVAHSKKDMQLIITEFADPFVNFGLTVSLTNTEVLYRQAPGTICVELSVQIDWVTLPITQCFTYLGSCLESIGVRNG